MGGVAAGGAWADPADLAPQQKDSSAVSEDSGAPVLRAGGVDIYPGFAITEKHNDNLLRRDADKISSAITLFSPSVLMQARSSANVYSLSYRADLARYASSSTDNYNDQNLTAVAELALSSRASLRLSPLFISGHDDRGSTYGALTSTPNTWHKSGFEGEFVYGAEDARGRIVVDANVYDIRYQNNRAITNAYDKKLTELSGTFYYRVAPKTYTFVQLADTRIAYQDPVSANLTGNEERVFLGVTWKATAQTTGSLKVGQLRKTFDTSVRPTYRGSSWEGSVRWSPREFLRLDLVSSRRASESTGVGNFVLVTNTYGDLAYDLTGRTTLHLVTGRMKEDFIQAGRVDDTSSYGVKVDYKLRSWLRLGAEFSRAVKTSVGFTGLSPEYHNNISSVYLRSEL